MFLVTNSRLIRVALGALTSQRNDEEDTVTLP